MNHAFVYIFQNLTHTIQSFERPHTHASPLLNNSQVAADHFYTSALSTAAFLASQRPNGTAYVIGEPGLTSALYDAGYSMNDVNPDFVVCGETRNYNYEKIEHAVHLVLRGARLIGTNVDLVDRMHNSFVPACGYVMLSCAALAVLVLRIFFPFVHWRSFIPHYKCHISSHLSHDCHNFAIFCFFSKCYFAIDFLSLPPSSLIKPIALATGRDPYFCGKPNPLMMRAAIQKLGVQREDSIIIGDRMDTDVLAGVQSGMMRFSLFSKKKIFYYFYLRLCFLFKYFFGW
jgi:ribonucleotide monophosphatase NagD (HAD superfamily)